jgi:phospholipid/cholesterol/gamma-HCH transport system ATP-binding protein
LPSIYTIADRVIMLEKGGKKIVATGRPQDLRDHAANPLVRQFLNPGAVRMTAEKGAGDTP